jgi:hypothetical protein
MVMVMVMRKRWKREKKKKKRRRERALQKGWLIGGTWRTAGVTSGTGRFTFPSTFSDIAIRKAFPMATDYSAIIIHSLRN